LTQSDNPVDRPTIAKAVALRYDAAHDPAPRIAASGRGPVAEQILRIALDHGVEIRQDSDLVEILAALDVDSVIPLEAFAAVAEILAYIYRVERGGQA
jgi:flagellar biosynthesis protein